MPLKFFDYMASGAPILAYGPDGPCVSIAGQWGAGLHVAEGDVDCLRNALNELQRRPRSSWLTLSQVQWVEEHERRAIVLRVLSLIAGEGAAGSRTTRSQESPRGPSRAGGR